MPEQKTSFATTLAAAVAAGALAGATARVVGNLIQPKEASANTDWIDELVSGLVTRLNLTRYSTRSLPKALERGRLFVWPTEDGPIIIREVVTALSTEQRRQLASMINYTAEDPPVATTLALQTAGLLVSHDDGRVACMFTASDMEEVGAIAGLLWMLYMSFAPEQVKS